MSNIKKPIPQEIPNLIIKTAQLTNLISNKLATQFAYKLFTKPLRHNTPQRELHFENNAIKSYFYIPKINTHIRVLEYGNGSKKALLTHGWSGRGTQLSSIAEDLKNNGYTVISFDAPAHGKSQGKESNMTEFMDCIFELQKKHGTFDVVIGHSLGGIALLNALPRGLNTQRAITIGAADIIMDIFEGFIESMKLPLQIAVQMKNIFEEKYNKKISDFDVSTVVKNTNIPTLIIHDIDDTNVPVHCAENIHKNHKNSTLYLTKGFGHRKILGEESVRNQILKFCNV
ncbi:MAG: alpha/beta hydrolase [Bacteroidota bacterium]|nr:alpha/beta hydrolase [Bacteroidota bacterium]